MSVTGALLLMFAAPAGAATTYSYTGQAWDPTRDFPLPWYQGSKQDNELDSDYQTEVLIKSFDNWVVSAECAAISHEYMGVREDAGGEGGYSYDETNTMGWDDPNNEVGTGVLGQTLCLPQSGGDPLLEIEGTTLTRQLDCDIIFNDQVSWGTPEEIESGACSGAYSIEGVATHEIGHLWGLDHSCEDPDKGGDECTDLEKLYATMYWSAPPCSSTQAVPKEWDIGAITSLYGPFFTIGVSEDSIRAGGAPLDVCFQLESTDAVTGVNIESVEWRLGDGTTSTEREPCVTYQTKGQYTVSAKISGSTDACDNFEYTAYKNAYVLVCEEPKPSEGFDGLFTYEPTEGLLVQMINQADTSVYGCVDQVQWDVFDGDELIQSISAWSPRIQFPAAGTYRVVLNLKGPGGENAAEIDVDVVEATGGCSTAPRGFGLAGALVGLGLALSRRRRR